MEEKKKSSIVTIVINIVLILALFGLLFWFATKNNGPKEKSYNEFYEQLYNGEIKELEATGGTLKVILKTSEYDSDGGKFKKYDYYVKYNDQTVMNQIINDYMKDNPNSGLKPWFPPQTQSIFSILLPYIILLAFLLIAWFFLSRALNKQNGKAMSFGKTKIKLGNNSKVLFTDVAGADEEKQELQEIVEFLKDPTKFTKLGARIPKGFLLVGPPGTGKTLLAKAVAGESNVPFFTITGSDFVEMFVGVGASRVRDLFEQAKRTAPCIIFIDEIDAVGRKRGAGLGGGNDEREQTLNQLLVQMDGFETNSGIIVMAATNRADVLDPALLRPGRFDRQIHVYPPDVRGREAILGVHSKNKPISDDVDFKALARLTTGFTGADIEMFLNEAAIMAARNNHPMITMIDLSEAINKVIVGTQKKSRVVTDNDKKITAYHEAGHAIVSKVLAVKQEVQEVSIIPRGGAEGYTLHRPNSDDKFETQNMLLADLAVCMGGRAAELLTIKDFTVGAMGDIRSVTATARKMVTEWGMSKLGPIFYGESEELFLGRDYQVRNSYSEKVGAAIDEEVSKLVNSALEKALEILKENKTVLENMAAVLLERETIYTDEIDLLMKKANLDEVKAFIAKKDEEFKKVQKANEEKMAKIVEAEIKQKEIEQANLAAKFLQENGILTKKEAEDAVKNYAIKNEGVTETDLIKQRETLLKEKFEVESSILSEREKTEKAMKEEGGAKNINNKVSASKVAKVNKEKTDEKKDNKNK